MNRLLQYVRLPLSNSSWFFPKTGEVLGKTMRVKGIFVSLSFETEQ